MNDPQRLSKLERQNPRLATPNQQQTAEYISAVLFQLGAMAEQAGLPFLKYLLDMTVEEAMQRGDRPDRPRTEAQ